MPSSGSFSGSGLILAANGEGEVATKSYSFTTRGLGAGTYYLAGYYSAPSSDANLSQASPTIVLGSSDNPYAAHAFLVAGGPGSASGGAGAVEIEVEGTSITDAGVRTPNDTEIIVPDITAMALNQFFETSKKWIGQVTYTLQNAAGSTQTTFSADFNYGWNKYEDFGNRDFNLTDLECVGLGGAVDTTFNIRLLKQDPNNWTYAAAGFVPGGTELLNMRLIHGTESDLSNDEFFAFKRAGLAFFINGNDSEGIVVEINAGNNNSVQYMSAHIGVEFT